MKILLLLMFLAAAGRANVEDLAKLACTDKEPESLFTAVVARLGTDDWRKDFKFLDQSPACAAATLIDALNPVPRKRYLEDPHAVWCVRALRHLTGLRFGVPTSEELSENEEHFLSGAGKGKVTFSGTWMSRGYTYVAPEEAQKRIISMWRQWFLEEGLEFEYPVSTDLDEWYW